MAKIDEKFLWFFDPNQNISIEKGDKIEDFEPGFFVTGKRYEIELFYASKLLNNSRNTVLSVEVQWIEDRGIVAKKLFSDSKSFFISWENIRIAFEE